MTSLFIATIAGRLDRRYVLIGLTVLMLVSLILIAEAQNFAMLMVARALLGMTIGGFWLLATATIMRLVPEGSVPKALGVMYTGNAVATAFAAPIGSYLGGIIGWRGVFWALALPGQVPWQPVSRLDDQCTRSFRDSQNRATREQWLTMAATRKYHDETYSFSPRLSDAPRSRRRWRQQHDD